MKLTISLVDPNKPQAPILTAYAPFFKITRGGKYVRPDSTGAVYTGHFTMRLPYIPVNLDTLYEVDMDVVDKEGGGVSYRKVGVEFSKVEVSGNEMGASVSTGFHVFGEASDIPKEGVQ